MQKRSPDYRDEPRGLQVLSSPAQRLVLRQPFSRLESSSLFPLRPKVCSGAARLKSRERRQVFVLITGADGEALSFPLKVYFCSASQYESAAVILFAS